VRPTRATVDGRAYLDLQNKARGEKRPTDELLALYALEGFLTRLAGSAYSDSLVLKGGVLLAAFDARRTTRDIDLQASAVSNDVDTVLGLICEIAAWLRTSTTAWSSTPATPRPKSSGMRTSTPACGSA